MCNDHNFPFPFILKLLDLDPIIFQIGPIALRWYSMMYLVALMLVIVLGTYRAKKPNSKWTPAEVSDTAFYLFLGAVLGGRVGYVLFYGMEHFLSNPLFLFGWTGNSIAWDGMSFHGGLIGVLIASGLIAKKFNKRFWQITDFIAPLIPLGLFFGRIGNFINGELWGQKTKSVWGVCFHTENIPIPRHPSQLYEALLEGLLLFIVLWLFSRKERPRCAVSGLFLFGYGLGRFIVEFFREPDAHLGYRFMTDWLTTGMLLCIPMIVIGLILIAFAYRKKRSA